MFQQLKLIAFLAIGGFVAYSVFLAPQDEQTADLGQVLDRTEFVLANYQGYLGEQGITEVTDERMAEFTAFYTEVLNADPRFYGKTLGLDVQPDASFLGFADDNANGVQDSGEGKVFTVEIDEENNRLIATDAVGNASGLRFSGTGFLAGVLLGNLINRQRSAGVTKSSFSNRNVTPRSNYRAPSSARSGGPRAGK
ncbi:hypothetical protein [Jannaschia aquimarina]|uniref:Uncharacterized protein n=1 Tax=Jannaschia aquimarina TaxID=935700 RepID=A0A0D1EBL9_9RHOB|nr:hypothetical protein [Jannaschia aquimarina]KIT15139.1 hypothetical protein jaqu_34670 [Jannaschia aquimarina]SNS65148.1 hypothetical protein SAMN05421775_101793 [Jannaschia aquimarina]